MAMLDLLHDRPVDWRSGQPVQQLYIRCHHYSVGGQFARQSRQSKQSADPIRYPFRRSSIPTNLLYFNQSKRLNHRCHSNRFGAAPSQNHHHDYRDYFHVQALMWMSLDRRRY